VACTLRSQLVSGEPDCPNPAHYNRTGR
jgi:hypothetical protein